MTGALIKFEMSVVEVAFPVMRTEIKTSAELVTECVESAVLSTVTGRRLVCYFLRSTDTSLSINLSELLQEVNCQESRLSFISFHLENYLS